jgi:hypothetical protein
MHQQSFANDPRVNGYAHGFAEATINGQRILWHTGDHLYFHSGLFLLPEHNTGFFIAFNSANGMVAVLNTLRAVMDHFYPNRQSTPITPANLADDASHYAGVYFPTRAEYTTAGKMVRLFQSIKVTPKGQYRLEISIGFPAQTSGDYLEVAPGVFRSTDVAPPIFGDVVFRNDEQGSIHYLFQQNNPTTAYMKAPWYSKPVFNLTLLSIILLLSVSGVFWLPIDWWVRRRYGEAAPFLSRLASGWQSLLCLSGLVFLVGFTIVFSNPQTVFGLSSWASFLFLIPMIIAILAMGMIVFTLLAWTRHWWSFSGRLHYTLVTISGLAFVWWLIYWNLWIGYLR